MDVQHEYAVFLFKRILIENPPLNEHLKRGLK